eukprot:COSAG01_NODE_317_length_18969_cov_378.101219_19_plen_82_part_00
MLASVPTSRTRELYVVTTAFLACHSTADTCWLLRSSPQPAFSCPGACARDGHGIPCHLAGTQSHQQVHSCSMYVCMATIFA